MSQSYHFLVRFVKGGGGKKFFDFFCGGGIAERRGSCTGALALMHSCTRPSSRCLTAQLSAPNRKSVGGIPESSRGYTPSPLPGLPPCHIRVYPLGGFGSTPLVVSGLPPDGQGVYPNVNWGLWRQDWRLRTSASGPLDFPVELKPHLLTLHHSNSSMFSGNGGLGGRESTILFSAISNLGKSIIKAFQTISRSMLA